MTAILAPTSASEAFWSVAIDEIGFETAAHHISYERCIDWLLDLHQSTKDPQLQGLVADVLVDVREIGRFSCDSELESLVLGALASVEIAFELAA